LGHQIRSEVNPGEDFFTGPLAIECPACARISEIMDPERDGHDGEIGSNTNLVGTGTRSRFPCPHCDMATEMLVLPGFSYPHEDPDGSAAEVQRPQDFFSAFWLYGACTRCRNVNSITGFECA